MTCKNQCLIKIQNKYKCVLSNLLNEASLTTTPNQMIALGKELANQKITIFSNLMNTERNLICSILNSKKLKEQIPSLIPYSFPIDTNLSIIFVIKIGPTPTNDFYIIYNNNGILERKKISEIDITNDIKIGIYNLIIRNSNIDQFRITSGTQTFSGCVSTFDDLTTTIFKELFYNFAGLKKYNILVSNYNDKYGLKFSTWTYYN